MSAPPTGRHAADTIGSHPLLAAPRSRPTDTWRWLRWDLPLRVVPMLAVPLLLVWLSVLSPVDLGLSAPGLTSQLGIALILGPLMAWLSWWYRCRYVGRVVVPTNSDNLFQSAYYVALNSPAEELLFRGLLIGWLGRFVGEPTAWALSTLLFGLYHIPARWGGAAVIGVTLAGALFGGLFLLYDSLLLPVLVHACATCGFLSTGPWLARVLAARRVASSVPDE